MWSCGCGPVGEAGLVYRGMIGSCGCGPVGVVQWVKLVWCIEA